LLAVAAPSRKALRLAQTICGWARPRGPQSVPTITFFAADDLCETSVKKKLCVFFFALKTLMP